MIALVVFTDGRRQCIERTIRSLAANLSGPISRFVIINDEPVPTYCRWLDERYPEWEIHHTPTRRGFAGTYGYGWQVAASLDVDYVCSWEDDFVLTEPVNLDHLCRVLDVSPHLDQMALLRQAWNQKEIDAGGVIEANPEAFTEVTVAGRTWIEQALFFTTNPSVYRRELCEQGWPQVEHSEGIFTASRRKVGQKFAYWGKLADAPRLEHIGTERMGVGY